MLFGAKMQHVDLDHAVEQNLRHLFQAAAPSSARLSRDQLRAAGLGAALEHFDAIDVTHRGSISADEWLAYLRRRPQK